MPGPYSIRSRSIAITHKTQPSTYQLVISKRKLNIYHMSMVAQLALAIAITIILSWTPPDICTAPPPTVCQWALVGCVLFFATHAYMAGSHWHIPEETYSSRFILGLWLCVVGGCIGTIAGIAMQAGDIASVAAHLGAERLPTAGYTVAPAVWTEWHCDTEVGAWVYKGQQGNENRTSSSADETGGYDPADPPPQHVLQQFNDVWRIDVFHRRVLIAFGLSVLLMLLAVVSTCLYESMMRMLWRAEAIAHEADEGGGETHHRELREWEAARKKSREVSRVRVPRKW